LLLELTAVPALCALCRHNEDLAEKLIHVLKAIRVLCKDVRHCKELKSGGHIRTLVQFIAESNSGLLREVLETVHVLLTTYTPALNTFKDERGLKEVCRAVRRTNSPFLLHILILYPDPESLGVMSDEGLAEWLKKYKIKGTRDFTVKMMCGKISARLAEYRAQVAAEPTQPVPQPQVMRAPIVRNDVPNLAKLALEDQVHPKILWYQRKRRIGISIQIKDITLHTLQLTDQLLTFSSLTNGVQYCCTLALYSAVTNMRATLNQSELLVLLDKQSLVEWKSLLSSGKDARIKLDFSRACDSEDETESELEEDFIAKPVTRHPNTVICIGGSEEEEELMSEEENCDDMGYWRNVGMGRCNSDSDHMEGLE